MSQFIQLHLLTSYPPSNLNRDDLGRPKTAKMGGFERLRVSSQSLKRNWRVSDIFQQALSGHIGTRTKRLGNDIYTYLIEKGCTEKQALEWGMAIASSFGKLEDKKEKTEEKLRIKQLAHISPAELEAAFDLADKSVEENQKPDDKDLELLRKDNTAVDIAMFGRMLADSKHKPYEFEAACQVAHAISVHSVVVEDDYFTAVDDLNDGSEDAGSAHIGETGFAAALFYSYICINKSLLIENLDGNEDLANQAIRALTEAATKISPSGKQNSYASRAYASFVLAEKGDQQPRSLSVAFLKPVTAEDQADEAVKVLVQQAENFDKVYGDCADSRYQVNALTGEGSFAELLDFVAK